MDKVGGWATAPRETQSSVLQLLTLSPAAPLLSVVSLPGLRADLARVEGSGSATTGCSPQLLQEMLDPVNLHGPGCWQTTGELLCFFVFPPG